MTSHLPDSNQSVCLASSSKSKSPQSNLTLETDQEEEEDDGCSVFWDHIGSIDKTKFKSSLVIQSNSVHHQRPSSRSLLHTPSKRISSNYPSIFKRNSTLAGIPSPSKGLDETEAKISTTRTHSNGLLPSDLSRQNGQPLRQSKRRKDRRQSSESNPLMINPSVMNVRLNTGSSKFASPLGPKQNAAFEALARRMSAPERDLDGHSTLQENTTKLVINSSITKPPLSTIKGKQPTNHHSDNRPTRSQLLPNQKASDISAPRISKASLTSQKEISSNSKPGDIPTTSCHSSRPQAKPNPISNDCLSRPPTRKPLVPIQQRSKAENVKPQLLNSTPSHLTQDKSKTNQSCKPTWTRNAPQPIQSDRDHEACKGIKDRGNGSCEPWEMEEDEEFGSQLLDLVDLVEKEQRISQEILQTERTQNPPGRMVQAPKATTTITKPRLKTVTPTKNPSGPLVRSPVSPAKHSRLVKSHINLKPSSYSTARAPNPIFYKNAVVSKATVSGPSNPNILKSSGPLGHLNGNKPLGLVSGKPAAALKPSTTIIKGLHSGDHASKDSRKMGSAHLAKHSRQMSYSSALRTGSQHPKVLEPSVTASNSIDCRNMALPIAQKIPPIGPQKEAQIGAGSHGRTLEILKSDVDLLFNGLVGDDLDWDSSND